MSASSSGGYWLWDHGEHRRWITWSIRTLSIAMFFVVWELVGRSGRLFAIVPASTALDRLLHDLAGRTVLVAALGTLRIAAIGYLLAAVVGLALGSVIGSSRIGKWTLDPLVNAGVVTPIAVLIPVMGVYFGFGFRSKVALVFLFCLFVITINTSAGVAERPAALVETARAFGITGWALYRKVVLPHALPLVLTGLRLGVGRAIQGAIIADLLLESGNLGAYLLRAGATFDMSGLLAGTFFTVLLGAALMLIARRVERALLHWLYV